MQVAVFSARPYDRRFLDRANARGEHALVFHEARLTAASAPLAQGADAVCVFVTTGWMRRSLRRWPWRAFGS
jgi:D-lactate dehydrogenase